MTLIYLFLSQNFQKNAISTQQNADTSGLNLIQITSTISEQVNFLTEEKAELKSNSKIK